MSLNAILEKSRTKLNAGWRGVWARVWYQPTIFSQQKFIIGALAYHENILVDFKFIQDTRKFKCVYDSRAKYALDETLEEIRVLLADIREKRGALDDDDLPPGLTIERVGFVASPSALLALEEAMSVDEVPMEYKEPEKKARRRFVHRTSIEVYENIFARIALKSKDIAPKLRSDIFGSDDHKETVNLVLDNKAGMISSGWSTNADQVVLEMYRSASSVESYMAIKGLKGEAAVFMLRPTEEDGLRRTQFLAIEEALNEASWKLEKKGMRIVADNKEDFLAEQIKDWAEV